MGQGTLCQSSQGKVMRTAAQSLCSSGSTGSRISSGLGAKITKALWRVEVSLHTEH